MVWGVRFAKADGQTINDTQGQFDRNQVLT